MNNWTGHGFVGNDPKIRTTETGKKVAAFSFATTSFRKNTDGSKISTWHNIIVWDKVAEMCEKYVKKGSELIVSNGEITYRTYEDKEGITKYITEITCQNIEFCGKKDDKQESRTDPQEEKWQGKKEVGAMSDVNLLQPLVTDGTPEENDLSDLPF